MQKIINSLKTESFEERTNYYSEGNLPLEDCSINIPELGGKLKLPLQKEDIEKLIEISAQAKFGLGEKTILDKKIRNSQEIKPDQFTVNFNKKLFTEITNDIRDNLSLPQNSKLKASLHNMLIYGPGQFF